MERLALSLWLALVVSTLASCADANYQVAVPAGFPELPVPAGNALTESRVSLGKRLFYDKQVSRTQEIACASCHLADNGFSDPRQFSVGVEGRIGTRNAPSIVNLAYLVWRLAGAQRRPQLRFVPYTDFSRGYEDPRQRRVDTTKAESLLGFKPEMEITRGMQRQVDWFRERLDRIRDANPGFSLEDPA